MIFAVGDPVQLKSGGQVMTAEEVAPNGQVRCLWHDQTGRLQANWIGSEALKKYEVATVRWESSPISRDLHRHRTLPHDFVRRN